MPKGVYKRSKKQLEALAKGREIGRKISHKLSRTQAQIENARRMGLNNKGKLKGKPNPHKGNVFGNDIICHHNDLCHGAERPDDITRMINSEHLSLHRKLEVKNGTHPWQNQKRNNTRNFLESLTNFLADPTGLSQKEIVEELEEQGIDVNRLKDRVKETIKKSLKERNDLQSLPLV